MNYYHYRPSLSFTTIILKNTPFVLFFVLGKIAEKIDGQREKKKKFGY